MDILKNELNGEAIAFFRIDCTSYQILETLNYLMYNFKNSNINHKRFKSGKINYLKKIDLNYKLLNELPSFFDILSGKLVKNKSIITITKKNFFEQANQYPKCTRVVIIIYININIEYISQFQYIFLLLNYLKNKGVKINIIIIPYHIGINTSEYFRIRIALKVAYYNDFTFLKNTFWFFDPNTSKCIRVYSNRPEFIDEDVDVGSIFPILSINKEQYNSLCQICKLGNNISNTNDNYERMLLKWCEIESNKFKREVDEEFKEKIITYTRRDNYLNTILFLYTCYAMMNEENYTSKNKKYEIKVNVLNDAKLTYIHEICTDFSQGILQLLENIIIHVIEENNNNGCGTLSLRLYREINKQYKMYIYINDLQFVSFNNLVKKFIDNNPRFSNTGNLNLSHFYDGSNNELEDYLNNTDQIAMHYGLQIFNCVVNEHHGRLYVSTGEKVYDNQNNTATSMGYCGTAYEIEFNIDSMKQQPINYSDLAFPINDIYINGFKETKSYIFVEYINDNIKLQINNHINSIISGQNKEEKIYMLKNELLKNCNNSACLIIDLLKITDIRIYEIIAKSLFLYLNHSNTVNNIAIVNLYSKYDVVKLFRQFALFFNRKGKSPFEECKKIFIIDKDGKLDVLIYGKELKDISKLSLYERIYGGIDSQMEKIINEITNR